MKVSLQDICVKLLEALKLRLKVIPIVSATLEAFGYSSISLYDINHFSSNCQLEVLKQHIIAITRLVKGPKRDKFNLNDIVFGYNLFLKFAKGYVERHNLVSLE